MKKTHRTRNIILIILASVIIKFGGTSAYYISQLPVKDAQTKKVNQVAQN